jgi:hypothetical protein
MLESNSKATARFIRAVAPTLLWLLAMLLLIWLGS